MTMTQRQYSPVERTYAEALLGAARRLGIVQQAAEEARALVQVTRQSPRLMVFLESPHISYPAKLELLDRVFKGRLSPLMVNLLHVLARRRRTVFLNETLDLFQELVEESEGILHAEVTTAHELGLQDKLRLKAALEKYAKSRLQIEYHRDPRLIGGVVCRLKDRQLDSSLRSALDELERRLNATTLKAAPAAG